MQSASVEELLAEQKRLKARLRWASAGLLGTGASLGLFVTGHLFAVWSPSIGNALFTTFYVSAACSVGAGAYGTFGLVDRLSRLSAIAVMTTTRDTAGALQRLLYEVDELRLRPKVDLLERSNFSERIRFWGLRRLLAVQDEASVSHLDARSRAVLCDLAAADPISHIKNRKARRLFAAVGAQTRREVLHLLQLIHDDASMTAISRRAGISRAPSIRRVAERALETFGGMGKESNNLETEPASRQGDEAITVAIGNRPNRLLPNPRLQKRVDSLLQIISRSLSLCGRYVPTMCSTWFIVLLLHRDVKSAGFVAVAGAFIWVCKYGYDRFNESGRNRLRDQLLFLDDPNVLSILPLSDASQALTTQPLAGEVISHITEADVPIISSDKLKSINGFLGGYLRYHEKQSAWESSADHIAGQVTGNGDVVQFGLAIANVFMSTGNRQEVVNGLSLIGDAKTAELLAMLAAATTDADFSKQCRRAATRINDRIACGSSILLRPSTVAVDKHLVQPSQSPQSEPDSGVQLENARDWQQPAITQKTVVNTASTDV
jgi:hypothetical protein